MSNSTFYQITIPTPIPGIRPGHDIVKVAVQLDKELVGNFLPDVIDVKNAEYLAQLIDFDQKQPLESIVESLCISNGWNLAPSENFDLRILAGEKRNPSIKFDLYVTSENRSWLKSGGMLSLSVSAKKMSEVLMNRLKGKPEAEEEQTALRAVERLATDPVFVAEFLARGGLERVQHLLITVQAWYGTSLPCLLSCLCKLMDHGLREWDAVQEQLVVRIASFVSGKSKHEDIATLSESLNILDILVHQSSRLYELVKREICIEGLIRHLENSDLKVPQNTLALINSLFAKAGEEERAEIGQLLRSSPVRNALENNVLKRTSEEIGAELAHQLGVLQRLLFNTYHNRSLKGLDNTCPKELERLEELRRASALDGDGEARSSPSGNRKTLKDYRRLGFPSAEEPTRDLATAPPGLLALDCMAYYLTHYAEDFTRMVLENSCRRDGRDCPFATASMELVKGLAALLDISLSPSEQNQRFFAMFFKTEYPFEQLFVICFRLLRKTWKEMHATRDDMSKVMCVAMEQARRALDSSSETFAQFQEELAKYSYPEIQKLWQTERSLREETEFKAQPIMELRKQLRSEMVDLVKANRFNILKRGRIFPKYSRGQRAVREKGKFWFWRLSSTMKAFQFTECKENDIPILDDKAPRVAVADIKGVVTGSDCPQSKESKSKKSSGPVPSFSIQLEDPDETINFIAPDEETMNLWTDGLKGLLGKEPDSVRAQSDITTLLNVELKIRLLDLEGIQIPDKPPPIPPPPTNFDFAYE